VASNDPSDTGGLFIGRRPGTGPVRYRKPPGEPDEGRKRVDGLVAAGILVVETLLCLTLFGPQPAAWFWVGSQVQYQTGFVTAGISTILIGCMFSLLLTVSLAKRVDNGWKLVRRAAGHDQERGAIEWVFAISVGIAVVAFSFWFFVIAGPGPTLAPQS
jgi:hypothetical protein